MPPIEAAAPPSFPSLSRPKSPLWRLKFVYYGPSGAGKTTTLRRLAARLPAGSRERLFLLDPLAGPTLYFDQLVLPLAVDGTQLVLSLLSVPGGTMHRLMRRLLLRGASAVIQVQRPEQRPLPAASPASGDWLDTANQDELCGCLRESAPHRAALPIVYQPSPFECADDTALIAAVRTALRVAWPATEAGLAAQSGPVHSPPGLAAFDAELLQLLDAGDADSPGLLTSAHSLAAQAVAPPASVVRSAARVACDGVTQV